jgi:hypothetical protein
LQGLSILREYELREKQRYDYEGSEATDESSHESIVGPMQEKFNRRLALLVAAQAKSKLFVLLPFGGRRYRIGQRNP